MPTEKRHSARRPAVLRMQVSYVDLQGVDRYEITRTADLSETGCRVTLRFPLPPRAIVYLQSPPRLQVSATARFQRPTSKGYDTGLEFTGGYRLTANN